MTLPLAVIPSFPLLHRLVAVAVLLVVMPQEAAGLAAAVTGHLGPPSPAHQAHQVKEMQAVMAVITLAAVAAARPLLAKVHILVGMAVMAVMAPHGATDLPMLAAAEGTRRVVCLMATAALAEVVGPVLPALLILAVALVHTTNLAVPVL